MPPPRYVLNIHHYYAASFFFVVRFALGFSATAEVASTAGLASLLLLSLALIADLFLELPYDPIKRLPFFDFLSPFPILFSSLRQQY